MSLKHLSLKAVLKKLEQMYSPPRTFLDFNSPLDLLVATILSAQCTDARVNKVMKDIRPRLKTPEDYVSLPRAEMERLVHSCGTYRNKAKFIQEMCQMLIDDFGGEVPETVEDLTKLPGVGRKTAAIIAYAVFGNNEAVAVDTHVMRLARRMGFTNQSNPDKISLDLMEQVPKEKWGDTTTLLISHGRAVCTALRRNCHECVFQSNCPSSETMGRKDLSKT